MGMAIDQVPRIDARSHGVLAQCAGLAPRLGPRIKGQERPPGQTFSKSGRNQHGKGFQDKCMCQVSAADLKYGLNTIRDRV